jgi:hypothetical protein
MFRDLSKGNSGHDLLDDEYNNQQPFEGFPFFVTRVVPGLYDIILLPADLDEVSLVSFSEHQACSNDLDACLVLSKDRGLWFTSGGGRLYSQHIPLGGILQANGLKACRDFCPSPELEERTSHLDVVVQEVRRRGGFINGDQSHGGRPATDQELESLSGEGADGVPKGLDKCLTCGGWRGECLGTAENYKTSVLPVSCRCDNNNRCARCGNPLHEHKLNSNILEPSDGQIWYVPGFACFEHVCPDR